MAILKYVYVLCALTVAACGFQPVYGTHGTSNTMRSELSEIRVSGIEDRSGQLLRNALIDRLSYEGVKADPLYTLDIIGFSEDAINLGIDKDASATRTQLRYTATMVLKGRDGEELARQNLKATSSYNVLGSQFTTRITREDAEENAINELANQALLYLELYFSNKN